jgi:hypothetical protein
MKWKEAELIRKQAAQYLHKYIAGLGMVEDVFIAPLDPDLYSRFILQYKKFFNLQKTLRYFINEELDVYVKFMSAPGLLLGKRLSDLDLF